MENKTMAADEITAENPEAEGEILEGPLTVSDLIQQLQQYPLNMEVRIVVRSSDEEEGRDTDDSYPCMYTEELVDEEPESDTIGEKFIGIISDIRDPEEDDFSEDEDEG